MLLSARGGGFFSFPLFDDSDMIMKRGGGNALLRDSGHPMCAAAGWLAG